MISDNNNLRQRQKASTIERRHCGFIVSYLIKQQSVTSLINLTTFYHLLLQLYLNINLNGNKLHPQRFINAHKILKTVSSNLHLYAC